MIRYSILRLMFSVLLVAQVPYEVFAAQSDQLAKKPSLQATNQSTMGSALGERRLASQESKKTEEASGNTMVAFAKSVGLILLAAIAVPAAIYHRIKDLLPKDNSRKNHDDEY